MEMPAQLTQQVKINDVVEIFNSKLLGSFPRERWENWKALPIALQDRDLIVGVVRNEQKIDDRVQIVSQAVSGHAPHSRKLMVPITETELEIMLNRAYGIPDKAIATLQAPKAAGLFNTPLRFSGQSQKETPKNVSEQDEEASMRGIASNHLWQVDTTHHKSSSGESKPIGHAQELLYRIVRQAIEERATDIHLEGAEKVLRVRFRIDGDLIFKMNVPFHLTNELISAVKVNSTIDIGTRQRFESGRAGVKRSNNRVYDLRIEKNPSVKGEELIIRILDKDADWSLDKLNLYNENRQYIDDALSMPNGLILVTGPTGSGKSTTLFSMLRSLVNQGGKKILTIEDPVEYSVAGANQVNVHPKAEVTFPSALRSFLRQDPDVIMCGEIRDSEVASIAAQAAETGHLVLSTLHTNDAASTFSRLSQMGLRLDYILSSIELVVGQRLVKKVNPEAWEFQDGLASKVLGQVWTNSGLPDQEVHVAVAKKTDSSNTTQSISPYRGRIAVHEVLAVNDAIREIIEDKPSAFRIKEQARKNGMLTMWQDGLRKIAKGEISLESLKWQIKAD